jgi:hypothetical protein
MSLSQSHAPAIARDQRRTNLICFVLGTATLLFGMYRAIPVVIGSTRGASSDASFAILSLVAVTLLVGHGSRRSVAGVVAPPSRACTIGLVFAYLTLAGLLTYAALDIGISAAFDLMRRYD